MGSPGSETSYIFVDWAGDPGFAFRRGSSTHLVVAAIFTSQYGEIQEGLEAVRRQRRLAPGFHFHYADATDSLRHALGRVLSELPFTARAVIVDKAHVEASDRPARGTELIERFVAEAVVGAPRERLNDAVLIVDGSRRDTKQLGRLRVAISRLCAQRALGYRPRRVRARPAAEEDGLQVADAIAGLVLDGVVCDPVVTHGDLLEKVAVIRVPPKGDEPPGHPG